MSAKNLVEVAGMVIRSYEAFEKAYLMNGAGAGVRESARDSIHLLGMLSSYQVATPYLPRINKVLAAVGLAGFCRAQHREDAVLRALRALEDLQTAVVDGAVGNLDPSAASIVKHLIARYGADTKEIV